MWLLFGIIAMIAAILNIIWTIRHREAKWFRYISVSFTALTLCAFLGEVNAWVAAEDWSALMDVLPSASKIMWFLTVASISINGISLLAKKEK